MIKKALLGLLFVSLIFVLAAEYPPQRTGTEDDPVIIEQSEKLPLSFVVRNSSLFIEIRNVNIYYISLRTSRNILVKDCKLTRSELGHCSKIEYRNTVVSKSMSIYTTNNIQIKDCTIGKLKLNRSNSNIIKNCSIAKIKTTISKDNVFESIEGEDFENCCHNRFATP